MTMATYRGFVVWIGGIVVVLGAFLIFVATGWPGSPDDCLHLADGATNTCYCEAFRPEDVITHQGGVRQPVNTWFNLYAIFTSLIVASVLYADRISADDRNVMHSMSWIPDVYVFAVLFL